MNLLKTSILTETQKKQILHLWNNEYPLKLKHKNLASFNQYLMQLKELNNMLLINEKEIVIGWYCDFIRDNKKWFAMILDSVNTEPPEIFQNQLDFLEKIGAKKK